MGTVLESADANISPSLLGTQLGLFLKSMRDAYLDSNGRAKPTWSAKEVNAWIMVRVRQEIARYGFARFKDAGLSGPITPRDAGADREILRRVYVLRENGEHETLLDQSGGLDLYDLWIFPLEAPQAYEDRRRAHEAYEMAFPRYSGIALMLTRPIETRCPDCSDVVMSGFIPLNEGTHPIIAGEGLLWFAGELWQLVANPGRPFSENRPIVIAYTHNDPETRRLCGAIDTGSKFELCPLPEGSVLELLRAFFMFADVVVALNCPVWRIAFIWSFHKAVGGQVSILREGWKHGDSEVYLDDLPADRPYKPGDRYPVLIARDGGTPYHRVLEKLSAARNLPVTEQPKG